MGSMWVVKLMFSFGDSMRFVFSALSFWFTGGDNVFL